MSAPPPDPSSAAAPVGWSAGPAGAATGAGDGGTWPGAATAGPFPPGGAPPRRRRTLVIVIAASVVGVLLLGGCVGLALRSQNGFEADTAGLGDHLLQPADLAGDWEVRDPGARPPVGPPFPRSTHRVEHLCPEGRDEMTRALVDAADLVSRESAAFAETALAEVAGTDGGPAFVQEAVVAYWIRSDADAAFAAYAGARDCTATWDYTAPDDSRWQVRNEPLDPGPFGPNVVVARTTYVPVDTDGPGGEPVATDATTTYLNVLSRDGDRLLLLSVSGLSVEETVTAHDEARANLVR